MHAGAAVMNLRAWVEAVGDLRGSTPEHRAAHLVERLLQRAAVGAGEGVAQRTVRGVVPASCSARSQTSGGSRR